MIYTENQANQIYDILVKLGGASESERLSFIYNLCVEKRSQLPLQWRFQGHFGFGGKYYVGQNIVSCYREELTPEKEQLIDKMNKELKKIFENV